MMTTRKRNFTILAATIAVALTPTLSEAQTVRANAVSANAPGKSGPLFDGRTFNGWEGDTKKIVPHRGRGDRWREPEGARSPQRVPLHYAAVREFRAPRRVQTGRPGQRRDPDPFAASSQPPRGLRVPGRHERRGPTAGTGAASTTNPAAIGYWPNPIARSSKRPSSRTTGTSTRSVARGRAFGCPSTACRRSTTPKRRTKSRPGASLACRSTAASPAKPGTGTSPSKSCLKLAALPPHAMVSRGTSQEQATRRTSVACPVFCSAYEKKGGQASLRGEIARPRWK